ncbi:RsfA family transcriptional regulator [Halalkalibacter krulwichiae]|uniref:Prespore-specific transcriptional regulator RsfA n=1 Tax=Halalkalibacter krulwichiae TaxID=199441 RepID=A0A1X9MCE6_9BACI|nr:RsfA family transcriptional regulator [Halalkalibacter krulwichiae]ARK31107.1 Prespore-specific transcriptional regulator RsfA [Halalkalibacter krulwichiae]
MTTIRQDAWSTDEDLVLAEVVLRHIREGSTQLSAFEEVGDRLSRTSAACGFRWNSTIRKKYESAIALAKKQRTKNKKVTEQNEWEEETSREITEPVEKVVLQVKESDDIERLVPPTLTMEAVISFLGEYHESMKERVSKEEIEQLKSENVQLQKELERVKEEKKVMTEDYKALLSIMDRARKLSLYETSQET